MYIHFSSYDIIGLQDGESLSKISDTVQHERYKKVLGNKAPKWFDKFQNLKYNDSDKRKEL